MEARLAAHRVGIIHYRRKTARRLPVRGLPLRQHRCEFKSDTSIREALSACNVQDRQLATHSVRHTSRNRQLELGDWHPSIEVYYLAKHIRELRATTTFLSPNPRPASDPKHEG